MGADSAAALTIPVETAGRQVGRIELAERRSGRPYSERDVVLLHRTASDLAAILEPSGA
jgi:hypothetical protein